MCAVECVRSRYAAEGRNGCVMSKKSAKRSRYFHFLLPNPKSNLFSPKAPRASERHLRRTTVPCKKGMSPSSADAHLYATDAALFSDRYTHTHAHSTHPLPRVRCRLFFGTPPNDKLGFSQGGGGCLASTRRGGASGAPCRLRGSAAPRGVPSPVCKLCKAFCCQNVAKNFL